VVAAMLPLLEEQYGNPSSTHPLGQAVRHQIERARRSVAQAICSQPGELVFTSGGTESINLAIRGALRAAPDKRRLLTTTVEHSAVRELAIQLRGEGLDVDEIGVDADGRVRLDELAERIREDTALVSVNWVNHETGVITDVEAVSRITAERGVPLHVDAVQAAGKLPIDVRKMLVTFLSTSAHKFHGPKGIGALFVRRGARLEPLVAGGPHESGLRAGTENVAGIVGMGCAAEAVMRESSETVERLGTLRDRFERGLRERMPAVRIHGERRPRVANTSCVAFPGISAEKVLIMLGERGICASAGSACSSGSLEPSHVLLAMAISPDVALSTIRFSFSRFNTEEEVDHVLGALMACIPGCRR